MIGYEQTIEVKMQRLYTTLSERDKPRYAGIEATKLGNGGIDYISKLFAIDPKTIRRGLQELDLADDLASDRVRKTAIEQQPQLLVNFVELLAEFTAGDPMREGVLWTNLSRCEISRRLRAMGTPASRLTVRKLLRKHGLGQRKATLQSIQH